MQQWVSSLAARSGNCWSDIVPKFNAERKLQFYSRPIDFQEY
jgi:hypothetical protein